MVKATITLIHVVFFLLYHTLIYAEIKPQLTLVLDKTQVEFGNFIHSTLYGINLPRKLLASDLQILEANFGINIAEDGVAYIKHARWPNQEVQTLQFSLYPRQTGTLRVERLHIDGYYTNVQTLDIKQGLVKGKGIALTTNISSNYPWERQQVIYTVEISTPELFASLDPEEFNKTAGLEIVALPATKQRTTTQNGEQLVSLRLAWAIFPLLPGEHNIALPTIQYKLSGRVQRTYFLPNIQLKARALPPYIPPTIPVANITIHSSVNVSSPVLANSLHYWKVSLTSPALLPYWLPPILQQLQSGEALDYLQVETKRTMQPNDDGVNGQVVHEVAFKVKHSGILTLPELRIQSFDPYSGRLNTVIHPSQKLLVLSTSLKWFLGSISALLFFWFTKQLLQRWYLLRNQIRNHKFALAKLEQCQDVPSLRSAMKLLGESQGLPFNLSLSQWAKSCHNRLDPQFEQLVERISRYCYGRGNKDDLNTIRANLVALNKCHRIKPTRS